MSKIDYKAMSEQSMKELSRLNEKLADIEDHVRKIEEFGEDFTFSKAWINDLRCNLLDAKDDAQKEANASEFYDYPSVKREQLLAELHYMIVMVCDIITHEHDWGESGFCSTCGMDGNA